MIAFICPTYDIERMKRYTEVTLCSFFATTKNGVAIVVDDGSTDWTQSYENELLNLAAKYSGNIHLIHFEKNGGLTRSWNQGLSKALELKADYAIAGNNDIIFTPNWYSGLITTADKRGGLVGPLSNAPGTTAKGLQEVSRYIPDYVLSDAAAVLAKQANYLQTKYTGQYIAVPAVNGFFQFASMSSWVKGKYDAKLFYCPSNPFRSNGRPNPTPLMTMNEDELQKRWRKKGMYSSIATDSFIFHYRSVTRGPMYLKGMWYRHAKDQSL